MAAPNITSAAFEGAANDETTFVIEVEDNGEPQENNFFSIRIMDVDDTIIYEREGTLQKGNIQIHTITQN